MAAYTTINGASVLVPGKPLTSAIAQALNENPTAIAEGASGAPIVQTGWHGYDTTNVGDATSPFYNGASQTTIETPNFADGYEYRILGRGVSFTTAVAQTMIVDYLISGAWETIYSSTSTLIGPLDFDIWFRSPRRSARRFMIDYSIADASTATSWSPANGTQENGVASIADNNAAVVTRARISFASRTFNAGQIYLLRRREY
jgi:hypothetical protein